MEQLQIAQYFHNSNISKDKRTELLKDVNYYIPDSLSAKEQVRELSGYTSLHFAVKKEDFDLVNELLKQGANLVKQGTVDGCSPLHIAARTSLIYESFGKLQEYPLINILLFKQVEINNTFNPKCKDGVSHLHIGCIVNHAKIVELYAKAKEFLDQATNIDAKYLQGYTPLHCAIEYSSVEAAEILLGHGANPHVKNAKGMSCVHLLLERIVDMTDYITIGRRMQCLPYEKEIERLESIIKLVLEARTDDEVFVDDTGLSALHVACTLRDQSMVQNFLNKGAEVNMPVKSASDLWPAWTPLHFAACSSLETMMLLMQNGANLSMKNLKGETALDLCARRFTPLDIQKILSKEDQFRDIILSDNCTRLLDLLSAMNDYGTFSGFVENLKDVNTIIPMDSPIWPGYNLLHLAVSLNERAKFCEDSQDFEDLDSNIDHFNCTEEGEALYIKSIELCLEKGCSVDMKNSNGQTPIHLAFGFNRQAATIEKLLNCSKDNVVDPNGLSHLHIACALGNSDAVERYLSGEADVNGRVTIGFDWHEENVRANSTPLHVAVLYNHVAIVEYLLERKADVYAKDSLGLTPIHLLISTTVGHCFKPSWFAGLLSKATPNLRDCVSAVGLSHLHIAAYADHQRVVDQLLLNGAQVDRVVQADVQPPLLAGFAGKTALLVAVQEDSEKAVKSLLKAGADVHARDLEGVSALQHALQGGSEATASPFVQMVKSGKCKVETCGMTPLHVACRSCDVEWARKLLSKGADVNARILDGKLKGAAPLYVLIHYSKTDLRRKFVRLVKLLVSKGADVTVGCCGRTPLHLIYEQVYADEPDDEEIDEMEFMLQTADLMLRSQKSYEVNPSDGDDFSHFHIACLRNDAETAMKFLDHGADVNAAVDPFAKYNGGFTSLHFAMAYRSKEVAYLLLERGADVNAEDVKGNKPLHIAFKKKFADLPLVATMISRRADINAKNVNNESLFYCLLRFGAATLKGLEYFLDRGCPISFLDITEHFYHGIIGSAMRSAPPNEMQSILDRLLQLPEMKSAIQSGFCLVTSVVAVDENRELTLDTYLHTIELLMNLGGDLDHQDDQKVTPLQVAASFYNLAAVNALLQLGADINMVYTKKFSCPFLGEIVTAADLEDNFDEDVIKVLACHAWKMRFIKLEVKESILGNLKKVEKEFALAVLLEQSCQDELAKAKKIEICQGLNVKDFLSELGAVAEYPRMCPITRNIVDKFFKRTVDLRRKFPEFCGLLALQYRKALARMKLCQSAKDAIILVCQVELPDLCLEAILRYFTNTEMKLLIEIAKEIA